MTDHATYISHTQNWLSNVIVEYSLCPFAKREMDAGRIHHAVIESEDLETQIESLILECRDLDQNPDRETSLLIYPSGLSDFDAYLDMLEIANAVLIDQGYEGTYQLASFHPQYRFDGATDHDPSDYTNRSPYPMLHILREASVAAAVSNHPNPGDIPVRNIALTREMGLDAMRALLAACYI